MVFKKPSLEPGRLHPGLHSIHQTGVRVPRLQGVRPAAGLEIIEGLDIAFAGFPQHSAHRLVSQVFRVVRVFLHGRACGGLGDRGCVAHRENDGSRV